MEYIQLGKSDLKVSKICLGCMSFGEKTKTRPWTLNQEETDAMIKRALDLGINFFDTANILFLYLERPFFLFSQEEEAL